MTYNVFSGTLNPTQSKPCMTSGHKHKVATISSWTHPSCDISRHYYFYCSLQWHLSESTDNENLFTGINKVGCAYQAIFCDDICTFFLRFSVWHLLSGYTMQQSYSLKAWKQLMEYMMQCVLVNSFFFKLLPRPKLEMLYEVQKFKLRIKHSNSDLFSDPSIFAC